MVGYVVLAVALAAVLTRLFTTRSRPTGPSFRFLIGVFLAGGTAAAATSTVTIRGMAQSGLEPFPHFTYLIGGLLSIVAAFCVTAMVSYALNSDAIARRRTTRYAAILAVCSVVMISMLLWLSPRPADDFIGTYGTDPRVVAYQIALYGFIAVAAIEFIILIVRYLRATSVHRVVQVSLGLEIVGAVLALTWCCWNAARGVLAGYQVRTPIPWDRVTELLSGTCLLFMAIGAAGVVWAQPVIDLSVRLWTRNTLRAIQPLWERLRVVGPQFVLEAAPEDKLDFTLQRRLIEIRDWQYRLRPYIPPDIRARAQELAGEHNLDAERTTTLIEAAEMTAALEAFTRDHRYNNPTAAPSGAESLHRMSDQRHEARSLLRVVAAIESDALVHQLRQEAVADLVER